MRILITNDDGIDAPGIRALAHVFNAKHDIVVVAPSEERSAASHGIISMRGLSYKKETHYDYEAFSVSGLPADCVKLAVLHLLDKKPDLVLSGINRGKNLGTDVMYSGTVSAAFEAIYMGVPSIALSASYLSSDDQYKECALFALNNLDKLLALKIPDSSALNINFPTKAKILGTKVTAIGRHLYNDKYFEHGDGGYILDGKSLPPERQDQGFDLDWYNKGYITISPIQNDRNDYKTLERIKKEWKD